MNKFTVADGYSETNIGFSLYFAPFYEINASENPELLIYSAHDGILGEEKIIELPLEKIPAEKMHTDGLELSISPVGMRANFTDIKDTDRELYRQ